MNIMVLPDSILAKVRSQNFWLRVTGAAFLTLLTFYVLFLFINPAQVVAILSQVSMMAVLLGFVFYIGSTFFRAVRFHVVHSNVPTRTFFSVASIHTLLTNVFPARSGELTFPVLLKRIDGSSFISSISVLFVVRIFDLVAVFVIFFSALAMTYSRLDARLHVPMLAVSFAFIVGLAAIFSILVFGKRALTIARRMLLFDGLKNSRITAWVFGKLELLLDGFSIIRQSHALWRIMLFSIIIWLCNYMTVFVLVRSIGFDLSILVLTLGLTFSTLFSSLPIHGLGSFGTLEGAWTLIFLSFGATKEVALATGFGFHIFNITYLVVLGILGMIHIVFLPKQEKDRNAEKEGKKKTSSTPREL